MAEIQTSTGGAPEVRRPAPRAPARGGISQPVRPSDVLAAVVGAEPLSRAEVTRKVWDYIKAHQLQDASDRRQILADDKLRAVFGKDRVSMFEMTRLLNQHLSAP